MDRDCRTQAFEALREKVPRRQVKQDRSALRQQRITEGAIAAISRHGIAGVTHRRVAEEAGLSLAATTYYYETKAAIIEDASHTLLARYVSAFDRFADRHQGNPNRLTLRDFVLRLIGNATGKHNIETLAWCEIILNAAHTESLQALSREWFNAIGEVWRKIAGLLGEDDVELASTSAIDLVIGMLFLVVPLGMSAEQIRATIAGQASTPPGGGETAEWEAPRKTSKKAAATRERILDAAVQIIITRGAGAVTFRNVADLAELSIAAPTYYFSTMSALLNAAQSRLFDEAKARYRTVMAGADYRAPDDAHLLDLTNAVFMREATEFRSMSLACYPVFIQSSRDASLRSGLASINEEQTRRWCQVMAPAIPGAGSNEAWMLYAIFTGKLIRVLSTGVETSMLARVRREFEHDFAAIRDGRHWFAEK